MGQLYKLAERLANDREDYKSADSLLMLAKVQGWIGVEPDSLRATFSKLSQADIDEVKERLKAQVERACDASKSLFVLWCVAYHPGLPELGSGFSTPPGLPPETTGDSRMA